MSENDNAITYLRESKGISIADSCVIASVIENSEKDVAHFLTIQFNDVAGKFLLNIFNSDNNVIRTISKENFNDFPMEVKVFCGAVANMRMELEAKQ